MYSGVMIHSEKDHHLNKCNGFPVYVYTIDFFNDTVLLNKKDAL